MNKETKKLAEEHAGYLSDIAFTWHKQPLQLVRAVNSNVLTERERARVRRMMQYLSNN